jgi:hypothetical protein
MDIKIIIGISIIVIILTIVLVYFMTKKSSQNTVYEQESKQMASQNMASQLTAQNKASQNMASQLNAQNMASQNTAQEMASQNMASQNTAQNMASQNMAFPLTVSQNMASQNNLQDLNNILSNYLISIGNLYARYQPNNYNSTTNIWSDSSVNGRNTDNITSTGIQKTTNTPGTGNASSSFPIIRGTPNTKINFKNGALNKYTLIYITRYSGTEKNNILASLIPTTPTPIIWKTGHANGKAGIAYHGLPIGEENYNYNINWFIGVDLKEKYRTNGIDRTVKLVFKNYDVKPLPANLGINNNQSYDNSDFEFAELMIFDRELTEDEYKYIEKLLGKIHGIPI